MQTEVGEHSGTGLVDTPATAPETSRDLAVHPITVARGIAVVIAVALGVASGTHLSIPVVILLVLYAAALAPFSERRWSAIADIAVSAAALSLSDGQEGALLALSVVAAYNAGSHFGAFRGVFLGWALTAAQLPALIPETVDNPAALAALVGIHPLTAVVGAFATQLTEQRRAGRTVLREAHRVLRQLDDLADRVPAGLDPRSVTAAVLDEFLEVTASPRAFLFTGSFGILRPAAVHGDGRRPLPMSERDILDVLGNDREAVVGLEDLPPALRATCLDHASWLLLPLRVDTQLVGVFVAAQTSHDEQWRKRARLRELAIDASLALDNARLFSDAQARAADAARRRIAHDLHDGVAQSLAHIRMELDLLSRASIDPEIVASEARRLSDVSARALADVRATIHGLRSPSCEHGLLVALREHIEGLNGVGGPAVVFEAVGTPRIAEDDAEAILRIVQEATSNAIRHAAARNVLVSLEAEDELISLAVEDDGIGISKNARTGGVGLRTMQDRSARLGAKLTVRDRRGGGTLVALTYSPASEPEGLPWSVS